MSYIDDWLVNHRKRKEEREIKRMKDRKERELLRFAMTVVLVTYVTVALYLVFSK